MLLGRKFSLFTVCHPKFQLTEVGVSMGIGQSAQLSVMEVPRQGSEHAATLPQLMEEQIVREMRQRNNPVTLMNVRV